MRNTLKNLCFMVFTLCSTIIFNNNIIADSHMEMTNNDDDNSYLEYYDEKTKLLLKVKIYGIMSDMKQNNLPESTSNNATPIGSLIRDGYGVDTGAVVFLNDNIAAEMSLGINVLNVKRSALKDIAHNYNGSYELDKRKPIYMFPAILTGQYYMAPYGGFSPYIGIGYQVSYIKTNVKALNIGNAHGFVAQIGANLVANDDTFLNLDLKKYFANPKITFKKSYIGTSTDISSKMKMQPLVMSIGFGYRL